MDCSLPGSSVHGFSMDSPGKNTGMDYHSLIQGIFPTQGLNPGLLHCRQTLYCLSYKEAPIDPISLAYLQSSNPLFTTRVQASMTLYQTVAKSSFLPSPPPNLLSSVNRVIRFTSMYPVTVLFKTLQEHSTVPRLKNRTCNSLFPSILTSAFYHTVCTLSPLVFLLF